MPRPPARLANCYVPLPLEKQSYNHPVASRDRKTFELRRLCMETSVLPKALGSSLVELGHTKVLCQVSLGTTDTVDVGQLECLVQYAPDVGISAMVQRSDAVSPLESSVSTGKLNSEVMGKESSLSSQVRSSLLPTIPLEKFPKNSIQVHLTILQDDGSVLSACISAATMALVDAGIELFDLITSCTVAVCRNQDEATVDGEDAVSYLADPNKAEALHSSAVICLAMTPNHKEVTLWSQSGRLTSSEANHAIGLCQDGCRTMHKFIREMWMSSSKYQL